MRVPSIKRIASILDVDQNTASQIRDILQRASDDPTIWRTRWPLRTALAEVDRILGNHGVEGFTGSRGSVSYSNTGDTYCPTVALVTVNGRDRWYLGSWGDLVERNVVGVTS